MVNGVGAGVENEIDADEEGEIENDADKAGAGN